MFSYVKLELIKIFSKIRSIVAFLAIGFIVPLIATAMYLEGNKVLNLALQPFKDTFDFSGNFLNGYLIVVFILTGLYVHIPLLIAIVAGDMLSGEATSGTYRMMLSRPISRTQMVVSKYIAIIIYTLMLVVWVAILSFGFGILLFGTGDLITVRSAITIVPENDVPWRFGYAFLFAGLSMSVIASIAFMFSSFVENTLGPLISTFATIILFTIITSFDYALFDTIQPFLFTNYINSWKLFFDNPVDWSKIITSVWALGLHLIICLGISIYVVNKKDILS